MLDTIKLKDGKELMGIVDFVNNKAVYFFDFTNNNDPDHTARVILWRTSEPDIRFSIWMMKHYPSVQMPPCKLLPLKSIDEKEFSPTVIKKGRHTKHIFSVPSIS